MVAIAAIFVNSKKYTIYVVCKIYKDTKHLYYISAIK